jgi:hypothetical protein
LKKQKKKHFIRLLKEKIMDTLYSTLSLLIPIFFGAIGYWISTFYVQPILQYNKIRQKVLTDLIFYANVIKPTKDGVKERYYQRVDSNRLASCELVACIQSLPELYKKYLRCKGVDNKKACLMLMQLSNCSSEMQAAQLTDDIAMALGIKILNN